MSLNYFSYIGTLPASKSLMNRALVCGSYAPHLKVYGNSTCDDVMLMNAGLENLKNFKPIECGHAGAVLRFMALRASRLPGEWTLFGSERLFSRPQEELQKILRQLGVESVIEKNKMVITSKGWRLMGDAVHISSHESSQFASAVLLNAWDLDFPLFVALTRKMVSRGYFNMTLSVLESLGMQFDRFDKDIGVPPHQKISITEYNAELDMSSAFALAAAAVVSGDATIAHFPEKSLQPDFAFVDVLKEMGADVTVKDGQLRVQKTSYLRGVNINLTNSPDMFPVLAALCALAHGPSHLHGAEHLKHKESQRIEKISELLNKIGRLHVVKEDGIEILDGVVQPKPQVIEFDPDEDHRMAMAAGILKKAGFTIRIKNKDVVRKSYPDFWQSVGEL